MAWIAQKIYKVSGEGITPTGDLLEVTDMESSDIQGKKVENITEGDSAALCKLKCLKRLHVSIDDRLYASVFCPLQFLDVISGHERKSMEVHW